MDGGVTLGQSYAIARYLARKFGKYQNSLINYLNIASLSRSPSVSEILRDSLLSSLDQNVAYAYKFVIISNAKLPYYQYKKQVMLMGCMTLINFVMLL